MKKFLSLIMAMAMVFSLAVPAAAVEIKGDTSKQVTASYTPTATYTVTVNPSENGSVTANPTTAAAGATVTLTVSPANGYKLDNLTVKDASGGDVTVNDGYTFEMPASNVTVTATFVEEVAPTYGVNVGTIENGTVTPSLTQAAEGTEITLTVAPAEGYELDTLTVGGNDVTASVEDGKYTFTMGSADVEVSATFKKINYTITVNASENGTVTAPPTATMGETVTLTVDANAQYELDTLTVKDAEDNPVTVTDKTFVMPASNVTVTATFAKMSISSVDISWGSMAFTYTDEAGWDDDGSEGAGTVTVTNNGDTTITASAEYQAETGYTEITGSFSPATKDLNANDSFAFTLTLSGKPNAAIPAGTKIGEVTITIE